MSYDLKPISEEEWVKDADASDCPLCEVSFTTFTNRRHHCRFCGRVVCSKCSSTLSTINHGALRGCDTCKAAARQVKDEVDRSLSSPNAKQGSETPASTPNVSFSSTATAGNSQTNRPRSSSLVGSIKEQMETNPFKAALAETKNGRRTISAAILSAITADLSKEAAKKWLQTPEFAAETVGPLLKTHAIETWEWALENMCFVETIIYDPGLVVQSWGDSFFFDPRTQKEAFVEAVQFWDRAIGLESLFNCRRQGWGASSMLGAIAGGIAGGIADGISAVVNVTTTGTTSPQKPEPPATTGDTIFIPLARRNNLKYIEHLLNVEKSEEATAAMKLAIQCPGIHGKTLIHSALDSLGYKSSNQAFNIMEKFIELGVSASKPMTDRETLNRLPTKGATPLIYYGGLTGYYDDRIPTVLVKHGCTVDDTDADGNTPLIAAAGNSTPGDCKYQAEYIGWLLTSGAVDKPNNKNRTALYYAAWEGKAKVVELLLEERARSDPDSLREYVLMADNDGTTALHRAADYSSTAPHLDDVVRLLLERCPEARGALDGKTGRTAFETLLASEQNSDRENRAIRWDVNHEGCKTPKEHTDGGRASVALEFFLKGSPCVAGDDLDKFTKDIAEVRKLEKENKVLGYDAPDDAKTDWDWKLEVFPLIAVESNAKERQKLYDEAAAKERQRHAALRQAAIEKKLEEGRRREKEDANTRFVFWAVIGLVVAWWWLR